MATKHDSSSGNERTQYPVEHDGPADVIQQRVTQARAMAAMVVGDGFDSFRCKNDDLQHEYLWALCALLDDAMIALGRQTADALKMRAGGAA